MSEGETRRRRAVIAALLLVSVVALWWWLRARTPVLPGRVVAGESPAPALAEDNGPDPTRHAPRLVDEGPPAEPPIIDKVSVEKTEVCQGEENLITVRAHTPGGKDDTHLHGLVAGVPGTRVPIRSYLQKDGSQPEPRTVTVFGRQNVPATVRIPRFTVKECVVGRKAVLSWRLRPNTDAEFDLSVQVVNLEANLPFEGVRYQWDFGDGESAETDEPWTIHDYGERAQGEALFSDFLVQVVAESKRGDRVLGRKDLVLRNAAFANLFFAGVVTLSSTLTPRFPVVGEDGVIRQTVRLWHHRPAPVRIDRVVLRRNFKSGAEPESREASVVDLLGVSQIPPRGIEVAVALDTRREEEVFSIDYLLEGESAEGYPVRGVFPIMTPTELPSRDKHLPVRDPLLRAKIKRAQQLLDKPFVTDEEMWALEREGAFDDLDTTGSQPPGSSPSYGDITPHPPRSGEPAPDTPLVERKQVPALGKPPGGSE